MIDKAIVRNHPDIIKLMGCIDSSFTDNIFWMVSKTGYDKPSKMYKAAEEQCNAC